jgi:nitrous oxidase accessory protein
MSDGPAAAAIAAAERTFPVLRAVPVVDEAPRVRPPELRDVPSPSSKAERADVAGIGVSLGALALGAGALVAGRSRRRG